MIAKVMANTSSCRKVRPDVKQYVTKPKSMESISWHQNVRHDAIKEVMMSKVCHSIRTYVISCALVPIMMIRYDFLEARRVIFSDVQTDCNLT